MAIEKMTVERAQEVMGAGAGASSDERRRVFDQKREVLEEKLAQATSPEMKAKYRETMEELARAFVTLELVQMDVKRGTIRPDLKSASPSPVNAPEVIAPRSVAPASEASRTTKRRKGNRALLIGVAAVALVLGSVLLAGWWRKAAEATAAHARQVEFARQDALARAAKDSAERAVKDSVERPGVEAKAAQMRDQDERKRELERRTLGLLAQLTTHFDGLDQVSKEVDRLVEDLKSSVPELARTGGWQLEWVRRRRELLEAYRAWLGEFSTSHPARVRLKTAERLRQGKDMDGAAAEALAGTEEWLQRASEPAERRYRDVARPLIDGLLGPKEWPSDAFARARLDEPDAVARVLSEWKTALAHLDDRSKRPVMSDWTGRVRPLWLLAGGQDPDFARWKRRFIATLRVTSAPSGAEMLDASGKAIGVTPQTWEYPGGINGRYTVRKAGYLAVTVQAQAEIDEEKTLHVTLEENPAPKPGSPYAVKLPGGTSLPLVWIAPGTFTMGSPETEAERFSWETPHGVTLTHGYWLGKTEVTQGQWEAVMGSNPSEFKNVGKNRPVERVSWDEAMEYCRKLTAQERAAGRLPDGYEYTLPTEAQWEYACRAGTDGAYAGELEKMAWYDSNSGRTTHPVGEKQANVWGLHDMHGNVWEWCRDWYTADYSGNPGGVGVTNPVGPTLSTRRVSRGGSWGSPSPYCRSANRNGDAPGYRNSLLGYRLALSSVP